MTYSCFNLVIDNAIAHIELNQPERHNCMTQAFWRELPEAVNHISDNGLARVIVISSIGKHFSSGLDTSIFSSFGNPETASEQGRASESLMQALKTYQHAFSALEEARLPVLAAIQGGCIGGGFDMVLACDSRYCTDDAYFTIMETRIAMTADVGTLQRLHHTMPSGLARELAYTGRKLNAEEALQCGLVNRVYPDQESLMTGVMQVATEIATNSPLSVYGCKKMLNYAREHTVAESLDYQALWQAGMFHRDDMVEAFSAKTDNRTPRYCELNPLPDSTDNT